jgi:hypothetical protein
MPNALEYLTDFFTGERSNLHLQALIKNGGKEAAKAKESQYGEASLNDAITLSMPTYQNIDTSRSAPRRIATIGLALFKRPNLKDLTSGVNKKLVYP